MQMSQFMQETSPSFFSAMKGDGFFKSIKQAEYLKKVAISHFGELANHFEQMHKYRTTEEHTLTEDQWIFEISAMVRWADYGSKSCRSVEWYLICDDFGIVKAWKLARSYDTSGKSSCLNPKKAKLIFQRAEGVEIPEHLVRKPVEVVEKDVVVSNHVGEVGKRSVMNLKLNKVLENFGYYGMSYTHLFEDEKGNKVTWFGSKKIEEKIGEFAEYKATVKEHSVYKEQKVTLITRVALEK